MNRPKKLGILLGVLALAWVAALAVMQMEERKEQIRETGEIILELPGESVQSLSWEYDDTSLAFHKDGVWLYDGDENFPVSEEKINELLEPFQAFGAAFVIEDVEDYGQYGLEDPVCTISLSTEERDYEIRLGDYSKMDSRRYVSIGDGNAYLAQSDPLERFDTGLNQLIENDEIPALDRVTEIRVSGSEDYRIVYEGDREDPDSAEDAWFAEQGGTLRPLDASRVDSYLWLIRSMSLDNYVTYHAAEEEVHSYGMDDPDLTVTIESAAEDGGEDEAEAPFVVHISRDAETKEAMAAAAEDEETEIPAGYVRIGDSPIIYKISTDRYQELMAAAYDDLRHTEVFWGDFAEVRQMEISLDGGTCTLTSEGSGEERTWFYQGEELEIADIRTALESLTAAEFTDQRPTQRQEIGLTLHLDGGDSSKTQIALYRYNGEHCLAVVDGESVSLVDRDGVVALMEAVRAVILR